ncbi:MAG: hypothetical protein J5758_07395, partial [Abditibacteriota bacterium]|nr:hypothetical protein [Abditibacteriota bacterium]
MRIYTLIAALALCLVAVCLWAQSEDETIKIGRLPYYLSEFAKAGGTEFLISKKSLADARVIRVRYAQRSWAEEKIAAICRPDEIADAVEKHMDSRITEYPLVETERLNKDLDLEIYETEKGLKSEWDKADAYLLVLRHDGRVVWFSQKRAFRSKPYGERQKNEIDRPDAMVLPDGRYLVVTSQSACYTKEAGGKLVIGPVFGGRINWIEETENKHRGMYKMPSGYPTVKILTDNVVRHSYPDGCEEHWALRLSGEDTEKNKSRFSAPAEKDDYVGNLIQNTYANLLWWNGKYGETTKECAEENSKRFRVWYFKKSVKEPVYDGGAYIKTEAPLSEIIPKEHLEKMQR